MIKFTLIGLVCMLFTMLSSSSEPIRLQPIENPLKSCPDSPNCERTSRTFSADSASILNAADEVLRAMNAESIEWNEETKQIHAVFKIPIFGWRDDVHIAAHQDGSKTTLFIRSASREGYSDLGVNKRRVNKFFRKLNKTIS